MATNFSDYGLKAEILEALEQRGFETPTPVQEKVFSQDDLTRDMIVQARTGSGKTLAFLIPLLDEMEKPSRNPSILILSPTRELALQISREAEWLGRFLGVETASIVGGMSMERQIMQLKKGCSIVVGTPGRVLDHINRGTLNLLGVQTVILDEGDNMLDMGFREELESILSAASMRKRTWLFSATMPNEVLTLCRRYLTDPVRLTLNQEEEQHEDISHRVYLVPNRKRMEGLVNVLLWEHPTLCLVFCHTRNETAEVAERLQEEGFLALTLHGDMSQRERNSALFSFKSGRIPILVATNVAARGLDIQGVSHVVQLGIPESLETFVHRSGRTGRAGNEGLNVLLLTPQEQGRFKSMLRTSKMNVEWLKVPDVQEIALIQREIREESLMAINPTEETESWAENLLERDGDPVHLIAQLLSTIVKDLPTGYKLRESLQAELDKRSGSRSLPGKSSERGSRRGERKDGGEQFTGQGISIRISKGRSDEEWSVGRILGALCSTLGVSRNEIGNIRMRDTHTEVVLSPEATKLLNDGGRNRLIDKGLLSGSDSSPKKSKDGKFSRMERNSKDEKYSRSDKREKKSEPSKGTPVPRRRTRPERDTY